MKFDLVVVGLSQSETQPTDLWCAECFLPSGVKYDSPDNEVFRNITQSRIPVFFLGSSTNTYRRDNEVDGQDWAYFSLNKQSNSTDFIVSYHDLQCRNKL